VRRPLPIHQGRSANRTTPVKIFKAKVNRLTGADKISVTAAAKTTRAEGNQAMD